MIASDVGAAASSMQKPLSHASILSDHRAADVRSARCIPEIQSLPAREGGRIPHRRRALLPSPCSSTLQSRCRMLGLLRLHGPVAQPGERRPRMAEVTSSSLVGSTLIGCLDKRKTPCKGKDRSCLLDLTTPTITPTGLSEGIHDTVVVWPLPSMNVFQPIGGRFLLPTQRLLESGSSGFHTPVSESMRPIPNVTPL
jgi:hypothetical protein